VSALRHATFVLLIVTSSCHDRDTIGVATSQLSTESKRLIADSLKAILASAYNPAGPGSPVDRLMSPYADSGTVVSASGGRLSTSRDSLRSTLTRFWENVGQNMRDPQWVWGETHVEVLSAESAVLTATYTIPHTQPDGRPHIVGGAWTAVFVRRGGRWVVVHEHLS